MKTGVNKQFTGRVRSRAQGSRVNSQIIAERVVPFVFWFPQFSFVTWRNAKPAFPIPKIPARYSLCFTPKKTHQNKVNQW